MSDTNAALRRVVVPAEELESLVRRGRSRGGVLTQDDVLAVITVELTHFGGDDATLEDYEQCRSQFQKFATAFRASSARQ